MRGSTKKTFLQMKPPAETILGLSRNRKRERDARRAFTETQKKEIFKRQKGKCAMCGKKLDWTHTEYDHKTSHSSGGKTTVRNGMALCLDCHRDKTRKETLKKVDKKRRKRTPINPLWEGIG